MLPVGVAGQLSERHTTTSGRRKNVRINEDAQPIELVYIYLLLGRRCLTRWREVQTFRAKYSALLCALSSQPESHSIPKQMARRSRDLIKRHLELTDCQVW